jgi:hypothetical protein
MDPSGASLPPTQTTVEDVSPRLPKSLNRVIWILLAFMALCIARAIVSQNMNYIDLQKYAHLQEASPFQERILMAFVLRAAEDSHSVLRVYDALFHKTVDTPEDFAVMVVDCVCLLLMLPVTVALRRCFQPSPRTTWLAPLMMLLVVAFTYVVHYEQRFTMPYDQLSLLLYSVGLLVILRRRGWLLLLVLAVATPNRETVVFLFPVWFWLEWREGRRISAVAFSVAGLAVWWAWRLEITHFLHLGHQHYDLPWRNNLVSIFVPVHWPQVVDIFAFLAVPMWMLRHYVKDPRLKDLWLATAPFIIAALLVGVWRENRIFGELSAIIGLTFALQLEQVLACKDAAGDALSRTAS